MEIRNEQDVFQNAIEGTLTQYILSLPQDQWTKIRCYSNTTLLHRFQKPELKGILMLVQQGLDINSVSNYGSTPSHIFARNGYTKLLELMLLLGADMSIPNMQGDYAIDNASYHDILDNRSRQLDTSRLLVTNMVQPRRFFITGELHELRQGVLRCRDIIVILLGLKKFRHLATLVKLDRFLVKQEVAVEIWTTRKETQWQKSLI